MPPLTEARIAELLAPYYPDPTSQLLAQLSTYLELLLRWNARTNLTSIREPEAIVRRHFGESLFAARYVPSASTLLDLGSGAGFPGLPIQLVHPELKVTLAESQNKKAAFLREAVRTLALPTEVWAARSELLPPERRFDVVALRAVDNPTAALAEARLHVAAGGTILSLGNYEDAGSVRLPGMENSWLSTLSSVLRKES